MSGVSIYIHYAGGKYVRASDYDRDTQELRNELNACKSPPGGCGYWREASRLREAERDELRVQVEVMREALEFAAKSLASITSSDGSGHADIALSVLRLAGMNADERETLVEGWKAKAQWRIDAVLQEPKP